MKKAELQHNHAQHQPAARQGGGAALESPQGEQIAQLEAMADASHQTDRLAELSAMVNNGPAMAAQRKLIGHIHNSNAMVTQRKKFEAVQRVDDEEQLPGKSASEFPAQQEQQLALVKREAPPQGNSAVAQAKLSFEGGTEYLDNTRHDIPFSSFNRVLDKARQYYGGVADLDFKLGSSSGAAAFFTPDSSFFMGGSITIKPLSEEAISQKSYDYNDRLAEVAHETHHAIDHFEDLNLKSESYTQKVISEFRTFAVHSAVATQIGTTGKNVGSRFREDARSLDPDQQAFGDSSKDGFAPGNRIFNIIKAYLTLYSGTEHDDEMTARFIETHRAEVDRAVQIFQSLSTGKEGEHDTYIDQETVTTESPEKDLGNGVSISEVTEHTRSVRKPVAPSV